MKVSLLSRNATTADMWHTGGDDDPYVLSYRGIDNETYYMLDGSNKSHLLNYSGCGNTVNANHPAVKDLIIESCRRSASLLDLACDTM